MGEDALPRTERLRLRQSARVRMSRTKATAPTTPPATGALCDLGEESVGGEDNGELEEGDDIVDEGGELMEELTGRDDEGGELMEELTGRDDDGGDVVGVIARFGLSKRLMCCVEAQRTNRTSE